jgi:D-tyrosyl-tRNA(Tyr) deacylase
MRLVIQRVSSASVTVENNAAGKIGQGLVILAGFSHLDDEATIGRLAEKAVNLRIFEDAEGKMNLSLMDVKGAILLVSQFTLYADCRKGRRPSFTDAAAPEKAEALYQKTIRAFKSYGIEVQTGIFGARMLVSTNNDGPVTIMLDSEDLG